MNNLEFIEKEIEGCKIQIEREKTLFLKEKREGILRHLNQIKTILEAWEVVKIHTFEILKKALEVKDE